VELLSSSEVLIEEGCQLVERDHVHLVVEIGVVGPGMIISSFGSAAPAKAVSLK
jgi:hypothetical protein